MAPAFYLHPKSILVSRGDSVEFKCAARGSPHPNITWFKDGTAFTDTSAKTIQSRLNTSSEVILKIPSVSDKHIGYYSCLATASNVQVSSRDAILSLKGKWPHQFSTAYKRHCSANKNIFFFVF